MPSFSGPMVEVPADLLKFLLENGIPKCTREQWDDGHEIAVNWIVAFTEGQRILRESQADE